MNLQSNYQLKKKFDTERLIQVQKWMAKNGFNGTGSQALGVALILLSATVTKQDLENFGHSILNAKTNYKDPESLLFVLTYTLSEPVNASTVERLIFDRMASKVVFQFVDGQQAVIELNIPINPAWKQPGGMEWKGFELAHLAQNEEQAGALISEDEFQSILTEHEKEINTN